MRKNRIQMITAPCKRCGNPVTTASRSIYGLDRQKAEFGVVCSNCATPEEKYDINMQIGKGIVTGGER